VSWSEVVDCGLWSFGTGLGLGGESPVTGGRASEEFPIENIAAVLVIARAEQACATTRALDALRKGMKKTGPRPQAFHLSDMAWIGWLRNPLSHGGSPPA